MSDAQLHGVLNLAGQPALTTLRQVRREAVRTERALDRMALAGDRALDRSGAVRDSRARGQAVRRETRDVAALRREVGRLDRDLRRVARAGGGGRRAGGGDGGVLRSIDIGPFAVNPRGVRFLTAIAAPALNTAAGAAFALGANATRAAAGLGALGAAAGGAAAVGLAGVVSVAKPAADALEEVRKKQEAYRQAVFVHGRTSSEADLAQRKLNYAIKQAPAGTVAYSREIRALGKEWDRATQEAQGYYRQTARVLTRTGRRFVPTGARAATIANRAVAREAGPLGDFLAGSQVRGGVLANARAFSDNLDDARQSTVNLTRAFLNVNRAALPFLERGTGLVERWTRGWAESTADVRATRRSIGGLIDDTRRWGRSGMSALDVLRALGSASAPAGGSLVDRATTFLERQEALIRANPAQVRAYFERAVDSAQQVAGALWSAGRAVARISELLRPVLDRLSQMVSLADQLGLLNPTAIAAGLGAYGALRGGGRRGGGGAPLAAGVAAGAAAGGLGGRFGRGAGRVAGGALRRFAPVAGGLAVLDLASFPGSVGEKTQAMVAGLDPSGLVPRPMTGDQRRDRATRDVARGLRGYENPRTVAQARAGVARTQRLQGMDEAKLRAGGYGGTGTGRLLSSSDQQLLQARLELYRKTQGDQQKFLEQLQGQRTAQLNAQSRLGAPGRALELQDAYGIRIRGGQTPERAMDATVDRTLERLRGMKHSGAKIVAENTLAWARQQARGNPAMLKEVDQLEAGIKRRFRTTRGAVQIINNQILTGSRAEWGRIRDAMVSPAEQARQEVTSALTLLQEKAVGSLKSMGFTDAQARRLIRGQENGTFGASTVSTVRRPRFAGHLVG